jgi:glycosidase
VDDSPPAILQWFESSYKTIERRTPDVFLAGYGAVWTPPPGRADQGSFSVGYDVYDRFDLGSAGNPTLYGTEAGIKTMAGLLHRAGTDLHIDFVVNHNGFSGTGDAASRNAFKNAGGYPGFFLDAPGDPDGDFHGAFEAGDIRGRLAGLIDIAHEKNHGAIRNPVPGFANNIPAGTVPWNGRLANVPLESNRRFYPDRGLQPIRVFDPSTGEQNIPIYPFNAQSPMAGDPVEENAMGYLMRNAQWLVQTVGVDGLRIDAAKHVEPFVLNHLDRAVYRQNPRPLLDGSTRHVFSYSEVFDGDANFLRSFIRKDINDADPGRVGGNRDVLDFKLYFALKANLENTGTANAWQNIRSASLDFSDDGLHNGSAGVKFVNNHDVFKPFELDSVAHAYVLMMPGNATVYFNGKEFGDNRDFPKDGRGDALSVGNGSPLTGLLEARETHGRGNYAERWIDNQGIFVFERVGSAVVGLSNRGDNGFDRRTVQTGFAPGTHLVELSGNHAGVTDPFNDVPEVVTVGGDGRVEVTIPRNRNASGVFHGRGYTVYGLPTPQAPSGLELTNVAMTMAGDGTPSNNFENGTQRQADVQVIKADSFRVRLQTREVRLLGQDALRDVFADGDNALLKLDGGRDVNHNGQVDFRTPGGVTYGFERFGDKSSPLIGPQGLGGPRGDGEFLQTIDTTALEEGYHFLDARAFRHRTDNGPAVFSSFKKVIYVDRLPPVSRVDDFVPFQPGRNQDRDLVVRSVDQTADTVHVLLNLPAATTDAQVLALVGPGNRMSQIDRDLFKYGFFDIKNGNNVATVVTIEPTGTYNVQRIPGLNPPTPLGVGLGDLNFNGQYQPDDVANSTYGFEAVLYSRNQQFNPAADVNADGRVDNKDLYLLKGRLQSAGASAATITAASQVLRRRGDVNQSGGTDAADIDFLFTRRGGAADWLYDLDVDGGITTADVDTLVRTILGTRPGDANLDGAVNGSDFALLAGNFGRAGRGWSLGNFNGDSLVDGSDFALLAGNFGFQAQLSAADFGEFSAFASSHGFSAIVPEPGALALAAWALGLLRRQRGHNGRGAFPLSPVLRGEGQG